MKIRVGIPIAFDAEAWSLLGTRSWRHFDGRAVCTTALPCGTEIVALRSGVGIEKGLEGAKWLIREGVHVLVSVGVASGLRHDLGTGDLIVGTRVIEEENEEESKSWESSPACSKSAYEALLGERIPAKVGPIVSVKSPVSTPKEKAELYRRSHALVSDMESSSIARAAVEADLPFGYARGYRSSSKKSGTGSFELSRSTWQDLFSRALEKSQPETFPFS